MFDHGEDRVWICVLIRSPERHRVPPAPSRSNIHPPGVDGRKCSAELVRYLRRVHTRTDSPLVYYQCHMWGGDVEEEVAWIVDRGERVYSLQESGAVLERTDGKAKKVGGHVLGLAMSALGLDLPGRFFALHERSFHWRVYRRE